MSIISWVDLVKYIAPMRCGEGDVWADKTKELKKMKVGLHKDLLLINLTPRLRSVSCFSMNNILFFSNVFPLGNNNNKILRGSGKLLNFE